MTIFKKSALLGMTSVLAMSACTMQEPGFQNDTQDAIKAQQDILAEKSGVLRSGGVVDAGRAYYGDNAKNTFDQYRLDHGKAFPAHLETSDALEIVTPEPVSIRQIELLVQELTGLNVVVRTRYETSEEEVHLPINNQVRINHKGSLTDLVETIASRFDLAWTFDGRTITMDRMTTQTYDLPLPSSTGNLNTSLSGVNVAGNSVSSSKTIEIDPWTELGEALDAVVEEPAVVTMARNSGQVTVFASPSEQAEAAKIIKTFDELYSHRIGLEIATFYVDADNTAELGTDLGIDLARGDISASLGQGLASAMQGGIGVIQGLNGTASFNMRKLASSESVADYQMSNTVAQNGVVAPVVLTNSKAYVSEITLGTDEEPPTVTTDNINSGISIYALPRLMRNGKIHLSVWVTQSELNSLEEFNTGNGSVQLPDADQRAVEYTLTMKPGETLIMGGYEQERAKSDSSGGIGSLGVLGLTDNKSGETKRTRMVLMVRPTLIGN